MGELRDRTRKITSDIRSKGNTVVEMWECEFVAIIKRNVEAQAMKKRFSEVDRLEPRNAFFGGRTNAIKLYHSCTEPGEEIRYVDFTSLYPYVCKYGKYPVGHPEIYLGGDIPEQVEGLMKCTILPPQNLHHPLLPYRSHGKLVFPLCRTCADTQSLTPCAHSESERAITGTWVTVEIEKALSLGYRFLKKIEAWHFPETEQYDPITKTGGLWAPYINLWLREKQQVTIIKFIIVIIIVIIIIPVSLPV